MNDCGIKDYRIQHGLYMNDWETWWILKKNDEDRFVTVADERVHADVVDWWCRYVLREIIKQGSVEAKRCRNDGADGQWQILVSSQVSKERIWIMWAET